MRYTWLVEFAYEGRDFHGLQHQPGLRTAGGELRARVSTLAGQPGHGWAFAARTDKGVSAQQNFATFWLHDPIELAVPEQLNVGDQDLVVRSLKRVARSVNARNSPVAKQYAYQLRHAVSRSTLEHERASTPHTWLVVPALDIDAMSRAALHLQGTHDFRAFRARSCSAKTTVRTIHHIGILQTGTDIRIQVVGDGFLRQMIRILIGTLAEVGAGLRLPETIPALLAGRDRRASGLTAPAQGLCLERVFLDNDGGTD